MCVHLMCVVLLFAVHCGFAYSYVAVKYLVVQLGGGLRSEGFVHYLIGLACLATGSSMESWLVVQLIGDTRNIFIYREMENMWN